MRKLANKKEYVFLIAIIAVALWGITENILRSFAINFTVVFWAECIKKGDEPAGGHFGKTERRKSDGVGRPHEES